MSSKPFYEKKKKKKKKVEEAAGKKRVAAPPAEGKRKGGLTSLRNVVFGGGGKAKKSTFDVAALIEDDVASADSAPETPEATEVQPEAMETNALDVPPSSSSPAERPAENRPTTATSMTSPMSDADSGISQSSSESKATSAGSMGEAMGRAQPTNSFVETGGIEDKTRKGREDAREEGERKEDEIKDDKVDEEQRKENDMNEKTELRKKTGNTNEAAKEIHGEANEKKGDGKAPQKEEKNEEQNEESGGSTPAEVRRVEKNTDKKEVKNIKDGKIREDAKDKKEYKEKQENKKIQEKQENKKSQEKQEKVAGKTQKSDIRTKDNHEKNTLQRKLRSPKKDRPAEAERGRAVNVPPDGATKPSSAATTDSMTDAEKSGKEDGMKKKKSEQRKIIRLAAKADWSALEKVLRSADKCSPELEETTEENLMTALMLAVKDSRLVIAERLLDLGADIQRTSKDGRTAIHYGAASSRDDVIKLLINRKSDMTCRGGPKQQLPLHIAASRASGVVPTVELLLKVSPDDARVTPDKDGAIALNLAAESGSTAVCRELLRSRTDEQVNWRRADSGNAVLHVACHRRDWDMAKLFVEHGADVNVQNNDGQTPLHISATEGDELMVKFLKQSKANPNVTDNFDRTPLHLAAERGNTQVVELLVEKYRADVSSRTKDGSTLMHISAQYGHPETALAFLKRGVPLLMPNKSGAICLHSAAMKGHISVIRALLQKGAPVDAKTKDNFTALHIAVEHCKPEAVQTLLGHGARIETKGGAGQETPLHIAARTENAEGCAEMLLKSGADVNSATETGETALHIASRCGHLRMVHALLQEGADATWQSKHGETALHVSVRFCHWEVSDQLLRFVVNGSSRIDATMLVNHQNTEGETCVHYAAELTKGQAHHEFEDTDLIKLMLDYGGDVNMSTKLTQETPLHYCARAGNADVLQEIVKSLEPGHVQAAVNKQSKNGWSPLLVASEHGHLSILKILLSNNARVDVFDEHGKAALHLAAENGHRELADLLLWHKAFVNAKSKIGLTPLHLSAENGYSDLTKLLVDTHGASKDAFSLAKRTPLHLGAQNGKLEVCNILLKMKADANAADVHGQTPLHLAAENDHSDVVKLFLKHRPELVAMANIDENGMTCAHIAASKGSVAVIEELKRFNKTIICCARNKTNESTTLHLAAAGGHAPVVRALLQAGASATDENADGMTAIHMAARHGHTNLLEVLKSYVSWKVTSTKTGQTALHVAAQYGQLHFCREMLTAVPATIKSEPPHNYTPEGRMREFANESGFTPLHLAAQSGHEGLVRMLLNSSGVQVDAATNVHGVIALHLAAQCGHNPVVSLLLSKSTSQLSGKDNKGRTSLHLAAASGHIETVALLLGQGADINCYDKIGWTPMHYAAKAGHLQVVRNFAEAGGNPNLVAKDGKVPLCFAAGSGHAEVLSFLLQREHDTDSLMDDRKFGFDLMVMGKANANKSLEEFVLVSPAPVDTAVKMSRNFRSLSTREKERAKDLLLVADFCEGMATELNALASSTSNAGLLLRSVDSRNVPFLDVLIECEQKEVVAHPSVQKYLSEVWVGQLSNWSAWRMMMLFCALLFIPPVWLVFSLPLKHRYNKIPVIKFLCYLVSHLYLIVLFVLTIVTPTYGIWLSSSLIPHWYEWLLLAWLSGLVVAQLTNPEDRQGLGWIKVIILVICVCGVTTHLVAVFFTGNTRLECLYIRNQFFGFALLLCFVQLLDFLSFHHLFGPWAIIIRDLMKDLTRFLVILSIFIVGFTLQMAAIYQPVYDEVKLDETKGTDLGAGGASQASVLNIFEVLFFAMFGLVEPENLPPVHRNPIWSITLAKVVFAIYMIVSLIVLINLLIAMMSDTYQRIQAQSDTEWKFGRAKLFRNMNKTSATPSPLNLFTKLFVYVRVLCKHGGKSCRMDAQRYVDEEEGLDTGFEDGGEEGSAAGNWMRRGTQVAPEVEDFLTAAGKMASRGLAIKVEDAVNWRAVAEKYLAMQAGQMAVDPNDEDTAGAA